jgi:hypothetical protein
VLPRVKAAIATNGPMGNADFEARARGGQQRAGGTGSPFSTRLHYLWMTGALTITRAATSTSASTCWSARSPPRGLEPVSAEEFARWHIERVAARDGRGRPSRLRGYLTFPRFAPAGAPRALAR